jgi:hypothetical protein
MRKEKHSNEFFEGLSEETSSSCLMFSTEGKRTKKKREHKLSVHVLPATHKKILFET